MSKSDQLLSMLMLLKARGKMTAKRMAEEMEISVRSVYRYIDALGAAGVPVVADIGRDGGYYIPERFKLEPLFFDAEEQMSLVHAVLFARDSGYPHEEALNRAVAKIKRYAAEEQAERLSAQEAYLDVIRPPSDDKLTAMLKLLEDAADKQTSVELLYGRDYEGSVTERTFDPYGIVQWKEKWYVAGYCHLRGDIRHFRVDRIRQAAVSDSRFHRPTEFSARDSLLESLFPSRESDETFVTVVIQGLPQALDDLCGHWLFSRTLVERSEEQARFRLSERHLYLNASYYLLSFGGKIRILEPAELTAQLAEIAESLLQYYRSHG